MPPPCHQLSAGKARRSGPRGAPRGSLSHPCQYPSITIMRLSYVVDVRELAAIAARRSNRSAIGKWPWTCHAPGRPRFSPLPYQILVWVGELTVRVGLIGLPMWAAGSMVLEVNIPSIVFRFFSLRHKHVPSDRCGLLPRYRSERAGLGGYPDGMKTVVSIPDDVFQDAERLASRLRPSRSQLYPRALAEFVARHDDDRVTALMDQAVREAGGDADAFLQAAAQQ